MKSFKTIFLLAALFTSIMMCGCTDESDSECSDDNDTIIITSQMATMAGEGVIVEE